MNSESYKYKPGKTFFDFEFESNGPNGKIGKRIKYWLLRNQHGIYFNVAFGDINKETGEIDDMSISNNKDTNKILSTIAMSVLEFSENFPSAAYYFTGSTSSRTRLYQMSLSKNILEIQKLFDLYGLINNCWELFSPGRNYEAFIFQKK